MKNTKKSDLTLNDLEKYKEDFEKSIANAMNQFKEITGIDIGAIHINQEFDEEKKIWKKFVYTELEF